MDSTTLAATISGAVTLLVAAITAGATYVLTKRREHEADWHKLKLERYTEWVTALSAVVQRSGVTAEDQVRYANAVNSISLVAPASVLAKLYAFQDGLSNRTAAGTDDRAHELLNDLLQAIRRDIDPSRRSRKMTSIRFLSAPPPSASAPELA
jgi:hypothetical protein